LKLLVIILGIITSVFLNGEWLTIQSESWVILFADFINLVFGHDGLSRNVETTLLIIWLQLPLIFVFTLLCVFLVNKLKNQRYFIYSFLGGTILTFFILPSLPILNTLLPKLGGMRYFNVFTNMFLFLLLFVSISFAIQKYNKSFKQDK
jgi:hypothetical protein